MNIILDQISCSGNEFRLIDCDHQDYGVHDCDHFEDVYLVCSIEGEFMIKSSDYRSAVEDNKLTELTSQILLCGKMCLVKPVVQRPSHRTSFFLIVSLNYVHT